MTTSAPTNLVTQTQTYRVGVGDVLDIQIPESLSTKSTLFTVMDGGFVDYPLAGTPVSVLGLTTEAIAHRLRSSIKFFFVGGEVNAPGQKSFHSGLTLTQAILASGGISRMQAPSCAYRGRESMDV